MVKIEYRVKNPEGIHAMPVTFLVYKFNKFKCNVIIEKGTKVVNGKKIFPFMSLNIKQNDKIFISFEGENEVAEAQEAEKFLKHFRIFKI